MPQKKMALIATDEMRRKAVISIISTAVRILNEAVAKARDLGQPVTLVSNHLPGSEPLVAHFGRPQDPEDEEDLLR